MALDQSRVIKKYSNRKLYDTQSRRYITLDDIARMVRSGEDVSVVQRDSGQDLTAVVLSQIVAREERRGGTAAVGTQQPSLGGLPAAPGEALQERGQALLDYLRRTINLPAEIALGEVERRRGDLETVIEGAITRALKRLSVPTRRDVTRLNARIDALELRLQAVRRPAPPKRRRSPQAKVNSAGGAASRGQSSTRRGAA